MLLFNEISPKIIGNFKTKKEKTPLIIIIKHLIYVFI